MPLRASDVAFGRSGTSIGANIHEAQYALVCARQSFLKEPPKDGFEEYAKKIIDRAYFIILNKIDELDGTNEKLLEFFNIY